MMNIDTRRALNKIQRLLDKGETVSAAAAKVGWRRQRAHAHVARGNLSVGGDVAITTLVDSPEIYKRFGKVISGMIKGGRYGGHMAAMPRGFLDLVSDVDDKKAYNIVVTRFAEWLLSHFSDRKDLRGHMRFIRYCARKDISLLRKVCVARYLNGND